MSIDPINLLQQLVEIPSLSGTEETAVHFLTEQMTALGLVAHVDEAGNAVGVRDCPDVYGRITHEVVLLGHIDTVPGKIPVRMENGRLYGRGTVDAKGPLAAFVTAAAQANLPPGTRVIVIGAVEEESATSKGARFAATQYRPDWCIIGEPSGWDGVTLGYKGRLLLDYTLCQPMGHTAGPIDGVAETAVTWWQAIHHYADHFNANHPRLFDQLMPSLRHICTGSDGLTNHVQAKVGLRLPPGFDVIAFTQWAAEQAGSASLHSYGYEPAFAADRRTSLAYAFSTAIRQRNGRVRFKHKTGTSDMNVVGPVWQCPIVAYGPGDSQLDHTPQEHIVINEYLQAIAVLRTVLERSGNYQTD
ncbi:MAG: [LysW]-lysine hydrolase [Candidatus Promineifilaceae bacterium]